MALSSPIIPSCARHSLRRRLSRISSSLQSATRRFPGSTCRGKQLHCLIEPIGVGGRLHSFTSTASGFFWPIPRAPVQLHLHLPGVAARFFPPSPEHLDILQFPSQLSTPPPPPDVLTDPADSVTSPTKDTYTLIGQSPPPLGLSLPFLR